MWISRQEYKDIHRKLGELKDVILEHKKEIESLKRKLNHIYEHLEVEELFYGEKTIPSKFELVSKKEAQKRRKKEKRLKPKESPYINQMDALRQIGAMQARNEIMQPNFLGSPYR